MFSDAVPLRESLGIEGDLRLLLVTNEASTGDEPGLRDAFSRLESGGQLARFDAIAPRETATLGGPEAADAEFLTLVTRHRPNVVLALSPHSVPLSPPAAREARRLLPDAAFLYWEGDAWGASKRPNRAMQTWASLSDVVFSVALGKQAQLLLDLGAPEVQAICHTYCHITFPEAASWHAPSTGSDDVVFIGSNVTSLRFLHRLPGGRARAALVRELQRTFPRTAIYGGGFTGPGSRGQLAYSDQIRAIRQGVVFANWDHFPSYASYASDRLAIGLVAGRPHVTTWHPESGWMPSEQHGLYLAHTVEEALDRIRDLHSMSPGELAAIGEAAHRWAVSRVSDVEAANFMISRVDPRLATVPQEPWSKLERVVSRR